MNQKDEQRNLNELEYDVSVDINDSPKCCTQVKIASNSNHAGA